MRDDRIIYTAAYGVTDTLRHTPTTIRTRFRIASISKPVTMAGILLLAAQGRLSLDDRVFGEAHGDKPRHDEPQYCLLPEETGQSYYLDIWRMDSHGGWIASAADVARFMARIDRNPAVGDIIPDSLASQFYFGFERWIHTGSLPGTAAVMIRIDDRYSFVLLSNKRSCDDRFWDDMSQMPIHAITGR